MQLEQAMGRRRGHVGALLGQDRGQPQRLARLGRVDVRSAPSGVEDHEPDQPGSDHEPDDEQPPVELGIHRREV